MDQEFSFGEWIEKRRKTLGLTQDALAEQVGYSAAMIRKIEDDERRPSPQAAVLLAEVLKIPQDQQDVFLKVARQERAVDRLDSVDRVEIFPWQTHPHSQTNLPLPATLFVGREVELAKLTDLLQDPPCRLVTLVGLAGVGKTRLAVQAARSQLDQFAHGVFFVSLAPLVAPESIVGTLANVIGHLFHGAVEPQDQLLHYLREKHMLLVLDNFEHLIEGASLLTAILQAAPAVKLLVTSRERLNLQGEWVFEVEGLAYPPGKDGNSTGQEERYDAVQLFLQSALRVNPGFSLNEENRAWVSHICRLMEGLPLGIELAASWARALSPQEIAREIENNLDFLKASARDIPERHRSLRAALDHSWKLLTDQEKVIFTRLSVFRGGFRREAAQEVAGASLEEIASLLDKSLLKRVGEERYDLHELIRQYGAVILTSNTQEYEEIRDRHSNYYATQLKQWKEEFRSPGQMGILTEIDVEIDNVRLAWSWMAARQQTANLQMSLGSLWHFFAFRGRLREGADLFREAVALLERSDGKQATLEADFQTLLGHLLAHLGYFITYLDRYEEADELLQKSVGLLRASSERFTLAEALAYLANLKHRKGEFMQARQLALEGLELTQETDWQIGVVYCLNTLSEIHLAQGDYQQAYELSSRSLAISREFIKDPHGTTDCLIMLTSAARHLGQYDQAKQWARESLQISKTLNDRWGTAQILRHLGMIHLELGETQRAEVLMCQCVSQSREIGDRTLMATALIGLGRVTAAKGEDSESKQYFLEALRTAMETKTIVIALHAIVELASIKMREGAPGMALELVTHSMQNPAAHAEVIERARQLQAELVAMLTPQQVEDAQARARTKSLEDLAQEIIAAS